MSEKKYRNPIPTVDAIIHNSKNQILLVKRGGDPFKDHLSLPGGFVNFGEKVEDALKREVKEEASMNVEPLEILGVYSEPNRDPRGHIMSVVFICLAVDDLNGKAGDDAKEMHWIGLAEFENHALAFDHKKILQDYVKWRHNNSTYWSSKL